MSTKARLSLFSIITIFVFVSSLISPVPARADGEDPTPETPVTESVEPAEENTAPSAPAEPAGTSNEPAAPAEPAEASNEPAAPVEVSAEAPASAPAEPEPVTVPEILEQAPAQTEVVVLNTDGSTEPLATQQAAEAIANSDPVWCPDGQTPGGGGCTANQATVTDLLNLLQGSATYTGAGTIYFQNGTYGGSETSVALDGATYSNLTNLGLVGGWDLGTNTVVSGGTTTFYIPIYVTNWYGNVTVTNINVDADTVSPNPDAALFVTTQGNIELNNVDAGGNATGTGAYLDNCGPNGCSGSVTVTDGAFSNNQDSGLVIDAAGNVNLTNVTAQGNGYYGADLGNEDGVGDVQITQGDFSNNDDTGLSVISDGEVTLTNVTASNNNNGVFVDTSGNVNVSNGTFNANDWTGLQVETSGNITLNTVDVSSNGTIGAYLDARPGFGSINITNSTFNNNVQLGLKAMTSDGNITLTNVTVDGGGISNMGAWLKTFEGGTVTVQDSSFMNTDSNGLQVVSSGNVSLINSAFSGNLSDGAAIYSTYSYACFGPLGIDVLVDGGVFENNSGYGLYVAPGPLGTLTLVNNPTFLGNLLGTHLLDLEDHCQGCDEDPDPGEEEPPTEPELPVNVVELPETGGDPVEQDCEEYSGTELDLPDGEVIEVDCPYEGDSVAEVVEEANLPGQIPLGPDFVSALSVGLTHEGEPVEELPEGAKITISFPIPEGMEGENFYILYWDPTANDGEGGWVELPLAQFGADSIPLNPDDPEDGRTIYSGVKIENGMVTVTVNFPGVFALVSR